MMIVVIFTRSLIKPSLRYVYYKLLGNSNLGNADRIGIYKILLKSIIIFIRIDAWISSDGDKWERD